MTKGSANRLVEGSASKNTVGLGQTPVSSKPPSQNIDRTSSYSKNYQDRSDNLSSYSAQKYKNPGQPVQPSTANSFLGMGQGVVAPVGYPSSNLQNTGRSF